MWRTLNAIDADVLERVATARAEARAAAWKAGMDPGFYVVDIDGHLLYSDSEKDAAPTYKRGFGFHPLLALSRRHPGTVGAPATTGERRIGHRGRPCQRDGRGVGAATGFRRNTRSSCAPIPWGFPICRTPAGQRGVRFIVGHPLHAGVATALIVLGEKAWQPAVTADGSDWREFGEICEITSGVDLSGWPAGCQDDRPSRTTPRCASISTFTDINGYRYQVCVTDLQDRDIPPSLKRFTEVGGAWNNGSATRKPPPPRICPPPVSRSIRPG